MVKKEYYELRNFIVCKENKEAYDAALKIIEGSIYDKLIIFYGNKSTGKTHLLNIMANGLKNNKSVLYITSGEFIKDVIDLNKGVNSFEKYSNIEVLIVDDIQCFKDAPNSMTEFEEVLKFLLENNKMIILSSDVALDNLKVSEQLKKTLEDSFKVKIEMPDNNTKLKIVNKIINEGLSLPDQGIFFDRLKRYIADNSLDLKELENMVYKLMAYYYLTKKYPHSLQEAIDILKNK